jgi:hypothetical protein
MSKKIIIGFLLLALFSAIQAQHIIGMHKDQLAKEMRKLYPDFVQDNSLVNNTYKYLKYIDKSNEQTLLVFLTDDDVCKSTKLISDYMNLLDVKNNLDKNYKPSGKDKWTYTVDKVTYLVTLKREKWFFSVFTSKKEKK